MISGLFPLTFILSPVGRGDQEVLFSEQENLTEDEIFIPFLQWD
jgi:hypothetical protein